MSLATRPSFETSKSGLSSTAASTASSKNGFLTKRSISAMDAFANWKQRFFVLNEGKLSYYKQGNSIFASSKDNLAHLKGEIDLSPDSVVRKSNIDDRVNAFEIVTPSKKLYCQADSTSELEEWIKAISDHIAAVKARSQPSYQTRAVLEEVQFHDEFDPEKLKSIIIKLLKENAQLREQLSERGHDFLHCQSGDFTTKAIDQKRFQALATTLDLRDVKKKQFQLWDSSEEGNIEIVRELLNESVVDVNGKGINEWTALHLAVVNGHLNVATLLVSKGAILDARTRDRLTPLHLACSKGGLEMVNFLLVAGADPNLEDQGGNTAMHCAAEVGRINIVKLLISYGARIDKCNLLGSLPHNVAPIGHPLRVLLSKPFHKDEEIISKIDEVDIDDLRDEKESAEDSNTVSIAFRNKYEKDLALEPRDFEFIKVLGRGAFAKVYLVRGKGSNKDKFYALKAYNKQAIVQKNQARYIQTEKATLQACSDHPFIVTLHYAFQSKDRLFLVMDYCGGGDLLSALSRHKTFTEDEACFYIAEIVLSLVHLHSKNIVFRDLKPENVVLDIHGHAMLTDFGISKDGINDHCSASTFCGSPMYLAPEMLSRSGHGPALDWYSVGALLYELVTGLPPFYTNDKKKLFHNILKGTLTIPDFLSPAAKSLLVGLLQKDPSKRLGSGSNGPKNIMSHPFFGKIDWKKLYNREIDPPFKPELAPKSNGIPDISNFPQAFTDQEISDQEKGIDCISTGGSVSSQDNHEDKKLFQDFDYQPEMALTREAKQFAAMVMKAE